jgi:hypothetical protein
MVEDIILHGSDSTYMCDPVERIVKENVKATRVLECEFFAWGFYERDHKRSRSVRLRDCPRSRTSN